MGAEEKSIGDKIAEWTAGYDEGRAAMAAANDDRVAEALADEARAHHNRQVFENTLRSRLVDHEFTIGGRVIAVLPRKARGRSTYVGYIKEPDPIEPQVATITDVLLVPVAGADRVVLEFVASKEGKRYQGYASELAIDEVPVDEQSTDS